MLHISTFIGAILFLFRLGTSWAIQHGSKTSQKQHDYKQNKLLIHYTL